MKINRRQRHSPADSGQTVTDDLAEETDDEVSAARADSDTDLDDTDLDDTELDGTEETDVPGADGPFSTGSRRGAAAALAEAPVARPRPSVGAAPTPAATRTTPRQFLHEVNVEMRKVAWPTRKETINYASVVFVTLAVLMALIFGLDYVFNQLSIFLFK